MNVDMVEMLATRAAIAQAKAHYFRGVDTGDGDLVRSILAEDCRLDYRGCCVDPASKRDFLPAMNVVLEGRASWLSDGLSRAGIISVHQGHNLEVEQVGQDQAEVVWSFTDHLFMPAGAPFSRLTGHGHYHETYVRSGAAWLIRTLRITRLKVEAVA